jgi:uncharacterized delta-60 repeat protein
MKKLKWLVLPLLLLGFLLWLSPPGNRLQLSSSKPAATRPTATESSLAPVSLLSFDAARREAAASPAQEPETAPAKSHVPAGEAAFADFSQWAEQYLGAGDGARNAAQVAQGKALAMARRQAMAELIKANPKRALELAAPYRWRQALPPEITACFEEVVSGHGKLEVYCALSVPGPDHRHFQGTALRYVTMQNRTFRAYVYGRRARQMSRSDLAMHGIAVDQLMALHQDPVRMLEPEEAKAALSSGETVANSACPVCGTAAGRAGATLVDQGGQLLSVCHPGHAVEWSRALVAAEEKPPLAPSAFSTQGTNPPPTSPIGSFGTKTALYLRVVFADNTLEPISESQAYDEMNAVNDFYVEASYNKTAIIPTVTPVLKLPQPIMYYAAQGAGAILADATVVAKTVGFDAANYDFKLVRHPPVPGFDWGGLGGGTTCWLQYNGAGLIVHELGHCYGLGHANYWETRRAPLPPNPNNLPFDNDSLIGHDNIIGPGDDIEYGDIFDIMGSGGGEANPGSQSISSLLAHFNVIGKSDLAWLPDLYVANAANGVTNRLYANDTPRLAEDRLYALKTRKDEHREYWVSVRSRILSNPWLQNGVELHWKAWDQSLGYSSLLDTTPGSFYKVNDSPLLLGRTYADREANVFITPVGRGGSGSNLWYDVVVNVGAFTNNQAPVVTLTVSTNRAAPGQPVQLSATATDANGDPLAYYWEFDDMTFGANSPSITKSWTRTGDYVVRCEVSDLKGGFTSKHVVVRVGRPDTLRISGHVVDARGLPLAGVRVHNGGLDTGSNDYATNYIWTYTDSDGAYTLVGLTNGVHEINAFLFGYKTRPLNFDTPLTLAGMDAEGVEFLAWPYQVVTVKPTRDADRSGPVPGTFTLARVGDTNTELRVFFWLGGTAVSGLDYIPLTNTVTQTNVVPTPFGNVEGTYEFGFVNFATGAVTTNITILPTTNAPPGNDKTVVLTLLYPLELVRVMVTNIGGTTLTNTNYVSYSGWEIVTVDGQETWFQTHPDYHLRAPSEATLTLKDQPMLLPTISVTAVDKAASENPNDAGMFTLTRFGRPELAVTVWLKVGGAATPGSDYEELPATVVFPPGETVINLPVVARADFYLEGNETVTLTVLTNSLYKIGKDRDTVTIIDNDLPLVTIDTPDNTAGENALDPGAFLVTRTGDMERALTVNYLVTGTAVAGRDYRALPGSVVIAAGQPSATVTVTGRDNGLKDGGNTVVVFISDSPTYNIGTPNSATVFIQDRELPTVTVSAADAAAAEPGDTGEFTIRRTGGVTRDLVVNIRLDGTAIPLGDYAPVSQTVRIPANSATATVMITPVDDMHRENAETVILTILPSPDYNLGASSQSVVTISDQDSGFPAVGFNLLSSAGPESVGSARIAVSVSAAPTPDQPVTVDYLVTGGTAIPGVDFATASSTGRLTFSARPLTKFITVALTNNQVAELDRTIIFTLIEPAPNISNEVVTNVVQDTNDPNISITNLDTNVVITPVPMNAYLDVYRSHTFTILDDDAAIITVQAKDAVAKEDNAKPGLFVIKRDGPTNRLQKVYLQLSGSAAQGSDFQPIANVVEIPIGADALEIPVIPVDDPVPEYMESVKITLLRAPGATLGGASSATVNIIDNDGTIEFVALDYTAAENVGEAQVAVRRTGDTNVSATVDFFVSAGTAAAGVDFVATNGSLTFAPGEALRYIPVAILDDSVVEPPETIALLLQNQTGGMPLGGQTWATLTITDDDTAVEFAGVTFRANENSTNAVITLRRLGVLTNTVRVELWATNDVLTNAAVAGEDFVPTNRTVFIAAGQTNATFSIRLLDDVLFEGDETVSLAITNAGLGAALGTITNATLVIVDDECSLEFAQTSYRADEYARLVEVGVRRVGGTVNPVSVDFATVDGSATEGKDYVAARDTVRFAGDTMVVAPGGSGQLILQPGETNRILQFRILDDFLGEGDETFEVRLSNPRGPGKGVFTNATVLGTITNTVVTVVDDETPGKVDFVFHPGGGADAPVQALAVQVDGKIVVGGEFIKFDNVIMNHIARLHDDGYLDSSFNPGGGLNGPVYALAVQPDGRVLVGGDFSQVDIVGLNRIVRLNADASVDTDFDPGLGADGAVLAIVVQPDGGIVLGGQFSTVDGVSRRGVARLNADGSVDTTFDPGAGASGDVLALAVQGDGKIVLGGTFSSVGNAARPNLARLNRDGSVDASFIGGTGPDGPVRSVAVMSDGRLVLGGEFKVYSGVARSHVAVLNADGSLDTSFDPGSGTEEVVWSVAAQADGKVIIGGAFTNYAGAARNRFARLNPNGTVDSGFEIGTGANDLVRVLAVQPNTAVVIGGDFTTVNDLPRVRVARIHGDEKFVLSSIQFASAYYRVAENAGQALMVLQRSGDLVSTSRVDLVTVDGSAKAGEDYVGTNVTVTFGPGETEKTAPIRILDDKLAEGDESVYLYLTNLPPNFNRVVQLTAWLTIEDDESAVAFSAAQYKADEGAGVATVTVRRTGVSTNVVTVDFVASDGAATNQVDYLAVTNTLTFNAGETTKTVEVQVLDDTEVENDETVLLELLNPTGGAVLGSQNTAVLVIVDNDRVPFYSLNITPPVGGSVTPPSGPYPTGSTQTITATPEADYEFEGWIGTTNSTANPLVVVMDRNYNLTALFRPITVTYTFEPPFSAAALAAAPWFSYSASQWVLQSATAARGQFALRSGPINDGEHTTLGLVVNTRAGAASFDFSVSSEAGWDFLEFYLDGARLERWSGDIPWRSYQFPVSPGTHTLVWRYVKDANFSSGLDAAFIDNLYIPLDQPPKRESVLALRSLLSGEAEITLRGGAGLTYVLEASTNLIQWAPIATNQAPGGQVVIVDAESVGLPLRFYRAKTASP